MVNPANEIIQSMMQGAMMGNMLRRAQTEQQQIAQERVKNEQLIQSRDLETRMQLAAVTRPVTGGAVEDTMDLSQTPGVSKSLASQMPGPQRVMRSADKSRMVKYKGADGSVFEGELLTPAEQASQRMSMELAKARALSQIHNQGALDLIRGQQVIGESPGAISAAGRTFQAGEAEKGRTFQQGMQTQSQTFQAGQQERGFRHSEKIAQVHEGAATARNREDNAAADRRVAASDARAAEREKRAEEGQARGIQTEVDRIQRRKTQLDGDRRRWGPMAKDLGQQKSKAGSDWQKRLTEAENKFREADQEWKGLHQQQQALVSRKDEIYSRTSGKSGGGMTAESLFRSYGK